MEGLTVEEREVWEAVLIDLEPQLSMYQLFLLLGVAGKTADYHDPREPMWPYLLHDLPLDAAPGVSEAALMQMAQAQALVRLGMLRLDADQDWALTPRGLVAVEWWRGWLLEVLNLEQPTPTESEP